MERKNQTLYLECSSGISGDMAVAALLDLGADQRVLEEALDSLPVKGFQIRISRVKKAGLDMCDFDVILDAEHENHDHDMEYLHGHDHHHAHENHHHCQEHGAVHHGHHGSACRVQEIPENPQEHSHSGASLHVHRSLPDIVQIIEHGALTDRARQIAVRIFEILAKAEAKAHGVPEDQVHFHEVGAVDSIVDIVAAAVCLDNLNITEVIVPRLCEGQGTIRCQHGILPVPVPAVVNITQEYGLPIQVTETKGELVTPTGAAIVAAVRTSGKLPDAFVIEKTGMGAGKRKYDRPSMLRAMLICSDAKDRDLIYKLETNIDDCSGESLGYAMERLMEAGARDVHYTPVYMKKNRPAYQLNVICTEEDISRMEQIIFEETTTIGIRRVPMERTVLLRENRTVQTALGEAQVKICRLNGRVRCFPEYNSVAVLCQKHGRSYPEVYQMVQEAGQKEKDS